MKVLIIFASARSNGNTMKALKTVINGHETEVINLLEKNVSPYSYENSGKNDDFIGIAEKMTKSDIIVFASPVYWYTMSAQLKTFFDRFTDLITIRKDLGRLLKNKICYVISSGADSQMPPFFESPFAATCEYFDMVYKGCLYCPIDKEGAFIANAEEKAKDFAKELFGV